MKVMKTENPRETVKATETVENCESAACRPFLTVIPRMGSGCAEMLRETVLCLCGQSDTDFEILLPDDGGEIREIAEEQPAWLRSRVRLLPIDEKAECDRMNALCAVARGRYIAFPGEGDLLFDHWAEQFKSGASEVEQAPQTGEPDKSGRAYMRERILRACAFSQCRNRISTPWGEEALRAESGMKRLLCDGDDLLRLLSGGEIPTACIAYPSSLFHQGLRFRGGEEMYQEFTAAAFLCRDVTVLALPTVIVRREKDCEDPPLLSEKDIQRMRSSLFERFCTGEINAANAATRLLGLREERPEGSFPVESAVFFVDTGNGYLAADTAAAVQSETDGYTVECPDISHYNGVVGVRFDPIYDGCAVLGNVRFTVCTESGEKTYSGTRLWTNGRRTDGKIVFFEEDPQILLAGLSGEKIQNVKVAFDYSDRIPAELIRKYVKKPFSRTFFCRVTRVLYRRLFSARKKRHGKGPNA